MVATHCKLPLNIFEPFFDTISTPRELCVKLRRKLYSGGGVAFLYIYRERERVIFKAVFERRKE